MNKLLSFLFSLLEMCQTLNDKFPNDSYQVRYNVLIVLDDILSEINKFRSKFVTNEI